MIVAGCCAKLHIVQTVHTLGDKPSFSNTVTEIIQKPYSQVDFYEYQADSNNSYLIENNNVVQEKGSVFNSAAITLDGAFVRNNLTSVLNEEAVETHFYGFYYLDGKNFVDNHTFVDHAKPNCISNEIYKGILDQEAKAVFNGKVLVRKDAQKTNAYQTNRNIVLSDDASINTKPQLEIFADDVKCSHGATSGYLDQDAMFYLKARGIPEDKAKALLLNAFAGEIVEKINIDQLRDAIKTKISERLNVEDIYFCDII